MTDPIAPDAITALIHELRHNCWKRQLRESREQCGHCDQCRAADALAAISAQVERLQAHTDALARHGVRDCERADAAEVMVKTLRAQLSIQEERTGSWRVACEHAEAALSELRTALTEPHRVLPQGDGDNGEDALWGEGPRREDE